MNRAMAISANAAQAANEPSRRCESAACEWRIRVVLCTAGNCRSSLLANLSMTFMNIGILTLKLRLP